MPTAEFGAPTLEDYQRNVFEAPWFRAEGVLLALVDDEWAGMHTLGVLKDSKVADINVDYTGVRKSQRGQGIATALKLVGLNHARSLGGTRIMTHNDSRSFVRWWTSTRSCHRPAQ